MPDEPRAGGEQGDLVWRLRAVIGAKDEQIAALAAALEASLERQRRLELRLAEVERRLSMDSSDSGTAGLKERIGAKEARRARQQSERERSRDRNRGGQPGHEGKGLERDPDPGETKDAAGPAECRSCRASLGGAETVEPRWAQVIDVEFARKVTEWALPGVLCPCYGTVTFAEPPPGAHQGSVCYGPVLNAAAVLLSCYGNVPPERAARVIGMLLGIEVSGGWVDKAGARVNAQLGKAGFDEAMLAALAGQDVLVADETPVNVLDGSAAAAGPEEKDGRAAAGALHVLITRTPDGRLTFLQATGSRRKGSVAAAVPASFTGYLITDGYTGYQHLLARLAGIQQCAQHVIRRCRAVTKLGPGSLQSWAADVITILRDAHAAVGEARARGDTSVGQQVLDDLLERYDTAAAFGRMHNRLRDWDTGNHPGYALGCWLEHYREQVFLFTRNFAVSWTNNISEQRAKAANGTRPSPATGIPSPRSPAGAACAATSIRPPPTASPHSTPAPTPSPASPGYRHSPPSADANSRHPVNGHLLCCSMCAVRCCGSSGGERPLPVACRSRSLWLRTV